MVLIPQSSFKDKRDTDMKSLSPALGTFVLNNHSYHSYGGLSRDGLTYGGRFTGPGFLPVRGRVTRPATPLCRGRPLILAPEGCSWAQPFPQRLLSHPKGTAGTFRALPSMVLPGWVRCTGFPPRAVLADTSGPDSPASLQQQHFLLSAAPRQVRRALRPQSGPRYCQSRDSGSRLRAFCTQEHPLGVTPGDPAARGTPGAD